MTEPTWDAYCVDHAAAHYQRITGASLWGMAKCEPPRNARETAEVFRKLGVRTLKGALTKTLGAPVDPKLAMRGDFVMVDNAVGICRGEYVEMMDGMQPLQNAECAWRIIDG